MITMETSRHVCLTQSVFPSKFDDLVEHGFSQDIASPILWTCVQMEEAIGQFAKFARRRKVPTSLVEECLMRTTSFWTLATYGDDATKCPPMEIIDALLYVLTRYTNDTRTTVRRCQVVAHSPTKFVVQHSYVNVPETVFTILPVEKIRAVRNHIVHKELPACTFQWDRLLETAPYAAIRDLKQLRKLGKMLLANKYGEVSNPNTTLLEFALLRTRVLRILGGFFLTSCGSAALPQDRFVAEMQALVQTTDFSRTLWDDLPVSVQRMYDPYDGHSYVPTEDITNETMIKTWMENDAHARACHAYLENRLSQDSFVDSMRNLVFDTLSRINNKYNLVPTARRRFAVEQYAHHFPLLRNDMFNEQVRDKWATIKTCEDKWYSMSSEQREKFELRFAPTLTMKIRYPCFVSKSDQEAFEGEIPLAIGGANVWVKKALYVSSDQPPPTLVYLSLSKYDCSLEAETQLSNPSIDDIKAAARLLCRSPVHVQANSFSRIRATTTMMLVVAPNAPIAKTAMHEWDCAYRELFSTPDLFMCVGVDYVFPDFSLRNNPIDDEKCPIVLRMQFNSRDFELGATYYLEFDVLREGGMELLSAKHLREQMERHKHLLTKTEETEARLVQVAKEKEKEARDAKEREEANGEREENEEKEEEEKGANEEEEKEKEEEGANEQENEEVGAKEEEEEEDTAWKREVFEPLTDLTNQIKSLKEVFSSLHAAMVTVTARLNQN